MSPKLERNLAKALLSGVLLSILGLYVLNVRAERDNGFRDARISLLETTSMGCNDLLASAKLLEWAVKELGADAKLMHEDHRALLRAQKRYGDRQLELLLGPFTEFVARSKRRWGKMKR